MVDPSSFNQQDTLFHHHYGRVSTGRVCEGNKVTVDRVESSHENRPNGTGDVAAVQGVACVQRSRIIVTEEASHGKCRKFVFCFLVRRSQNPNTMRSTPKFPLSL